MDELDRALDRLPRDLPPRRDLWPGIAAELTAATAAPAARPARAHRRAWFGLAASVLVVAIAVGVFRPPSSTPAPPVALDGAMATLLPADYLDAREQLLRAFPTDVAALPPETRVAAEQDLATVHRALQDVGSALAADAASPLLQELFINACQDEMRLLLAVQEAASTDRGV